MSAAQPAGRLWHPKPWRRGAQFLPPRIRRLSAPALRDWRGFIAVAHRQRLITAARLDVAVQLLQLVGWRSGQQVALAQLAGASDKSVDTAHRALDDLEHLGLVKRHHMLTRGKDGRTRQDASVIELLPAPASDPQPAGGRIPLGLRTLFLAWKGTKRCGAIALGTVQRLLGNGSGATGGGDDEWARLNAARQLAALAAAG
jgi:IclR helix-turn-helix domain